MLEFKNVTFKYVGAQENALEDISFTVNDGDFIGITGAGGAGKSSLTYAMNGVVPHCYKGDFYGAVLVDGKDTVETDPEDIAVILGSVFQDIDAQLIMPNVYEEMLFGLENFGVEHSEIEKRIDEALSMVGIEDLKHRDIATLSGGQKQKVAIASIIALNPKYLVLDEPTGELDPKSSRRIFELLKELNEKHGITVIVVEQKIMLLCEFVKKLIVMRDGKILLNGNVDEVLRHSDELLETGINVPRIVTLAQILREKGKFDGKMPVNIQEAVNMAKEVQSK